MEKSCENCRYAIYDSVSYGMGSCDCLTECQKMDEMTDEQVKQSENGVCDLWEIDE